jgi:endogenous inhibitor of DNA gyrase (YacG/DUF329 family)
MQDFSSESQFPYFHPEYGWLLANRSANCQLSLWLPQRHRRFYRCQLCQLNRWDNVMKEIKEQQDQEHAQAKSFMDDHNYTLIDGRINIHDHDHDDHSHISKSDSPSDEDVHLCQCDNKVTPHDHDSDGIESS